MSGERQTVAGAYMKIAAHEELCAERYRGINEKLSWVLRSLVGMLVALLAWALVQLYALEPLRKQVPLEGKGSANNREAGPLAVVPEADSMPTKQRWPRDRSGARLQMRSATVERYDSNSSCGCKG